LQRRSRALRCAALQAATPGALGSASGGCTRRCCAAAVREGERRAGERRALAAAARGALGMYPRTPLCRPPRRGSAAMDLSGNKKCAAAPAHFARLRAARPTRACRSLACYARALPPAPHAPPLRARRYDPDMMPQMEANVEAQANAPAALRSSARARSRTQHTAARVAPRAALRTPRVSRSRAPRPRCHVTRPPAPRRTMRRPRARCCGCT
jgi:hypothetical protein